MGYAAMARDDAKAHIVGVNKPAHGMYADLPRTIKEAKQKWKPEKHAHPDSVGQSVGELEGD